MKQFILVTGGSGGNGAAICRELARQPAFAGNTVTLGGDLSCQPKAAILVRRYRQCRFLVESAAANMLSIALDINASE